MKKFILACGAALLAFSAYAKDIQELVLTTNPPMHCENCENKIKGNLRFEKGVKKITTNVADQRVVIEYDADKTNPEQIEKGFEKIGYQVEVIKDNSTANCDDQASGSNESAQASQSCSGNCCKKQ